jgi:hypothetical protein
MTIECKMRAASIAGLALMMALPVFGAKDDLRVANVANVKIASVTTTNFSSMSGGGNRHVTINQNLYVGQQIVLDATWGIVQASPSTTSYPKNSVTFSGQTSVGPTTLSMNAGGFCDFATAGSTCDRTITINGPSTLNDVVNGDSYQLKITPNNLGTGNTALTQSFLFINFTVVAQPKIDTTLSVDHKCSLLKAGSIDLTATLTANGGAVANRSILFKVDGSSVGFAFTNTSGVASLAFNVNALGVGDHVIYAEFAGDSAYNGSNDSADLGISYKFIGFQQPINADGTSVFSNGRVLPVKVKITDANNQPVTGASIQVYFSKNAPSTELGMDTEPASSVSSADIGNTMRYDASTDQYMYNWDLPSLTTGTWYVILELNDSKKCSQGLPSAVLTVKQKGK